MPVEIGQRFGRLVVIDKTDERRHGQIVWDCLCDCGNRARIVTHSLARGATRSCGCIGREERANRRHDLIGQRFGKLVVQDLQPDGRWLCECDCGNSIMVSSRNLKKAAALGQMRSCGCTRSERIAAMHQQRQMGWDTMETMRVDGTNISLIRSDKPSLASKTGVRGVSVMPDGRYRATLVFRRRSYHLGVYKTIEEAAKARADAEARLYAPVIARWEADRES